MSNHLRAIPADPESLDVTRPEDIDVCERCNGTGDRMVWLGDGYDAADCWACRGTGVVAGYPGAAVHTLPTTSTTPRVDVLFPGGAA